MQREATTVVDLTLGVKLAGLVDAIKGSDFDEIKKIIRSDYGPLIINSVSNDPDAAWDVEKTPLMFAVKYSNIEIVDYLFKNGADVEKATSASPLMIASEDGKTEIVEYLIRVGANVNAEVDGHVALWEAMPHIETMRLLLDNGADPNYTHENISLVSAAAEYDDTAAMELLVRRGADIHQRIFGGTLLCAFIGWTNSDIIDLLINEGIDIDDKNREGETALIIAAMMGRSGNVRKLIHAGADCTIRDRHGKSALYHACLNGHTYIAELILYEMARKGVPYETYWEDPQINKADYVAASTVRSEVIHRMTRTPTTRQAYESWRPSEGMQTKAARCMFSHMASALSK